MRDLARIVSLLAFGMGLEALMGQVSPSAAIVVALAVLVMVAPLDPAVRRLRRHAE